MDYAHLNVPNPDNKDEISEEAFEDVTGELKGWLKQLQAGQTLLAPAFSMEDAMHAWEVLSAKMDAGVGYANTKLATEARADGSLKDSSQLSDAELCCVMDKILSLELVLYRGFNALYTLATCHYLWDVQLITNPVLQLYCRATLASALCASQVVGECDIAYEEENVRLGDEFPVDTTLIGARPEILQQLADAAAAASQRGADAIAARISLRRSLLELLGSIYDKVGAPPQSYQELCRRLVVAVDPLHDRLQPDACPAGVVEPHIVRRDLGHATPARSIPTLTGAQCEEELRTLVAHFGLISEVPTGAAVSVEDLLVFLNILTIQKPCVLARCVLRRWMWFKGKALGSQPVASVTQSFLSLYKCPSHYLAHPRTVKENFLDSQESVLHHMFITMCLNPARQRRRLRELIENGGPMAQVSLEVDRLVSTDMEKRRFHRFFGAFQGLLNTHMCLQHLRLGSLMGLYETDELANIHWYMWYLHKDLDTWKDLVDAAKLKDEKKKDAKGNANNKKKKQQTGAVKAKKIKIITHNDIIRAVEANLCRGVYLSFLAFELLGLYKPPKYELQPSRMRWYQRMLPMSRPTFVPQPAQFEQFLQTRAADVKSAGSAQALVAQAVEAYQVAKQKVEAATRSLGDHAKNYQTSYLRSLAKVAVINLLSLQSIGPDSDGITVDFSACAFYPAVKVGKKQKQ